MDNRFYFWTYGQLDKFINENCVVPDLFNIGQKRNITYYDILKDNGYKYILYDNGKLEIWKD